MEGPARVTVLAQVFSSAAVHTSGPKILEEIQKWEKAFAPLLETTRNNPLAFIPASTLSVQAQTLHISTHGFTAIHEDFDPFSETANVLTLCESMVAHPRFLKTFVFDIGIIPPLWMLILMCPCPQLKKRAVKILRDMEPRTECAWNSKIVADNGDALIARKGDRSPWLPHGWSAPNVELYPRGHDTDLRSSSTEPFVNGEAISTLDRKQASRLSAIEFGTLIWMCWNLI